MKNTHTFIAPVPANEVCYNFPNAALSEPSLSTLLWAKLLSQVSVQGVRKLLKRSFLRALSLYPATGQAAFSGIHARCMQTGENASGSLTGPIEGLPH